MYPLIHRKSKLKLENKMRIVKVIFIPSLLYGCKAWITEKSNQKHKIERKVNKIIKVQKKELSEKMEEHRNDLIKEIIMAKGPRKADKTGSNLVYHRSIRKS